jgi:hypothetical protein
LEQLEEKAEVDMDQVETVEKKKDEEEEQKEGDSEADKKQ